MADIADILNRSGQCNTPCNDNGVPIVDAEECFGYSAANAEEPSCPEWQLGFRDCEEVPTPNLIGKINWMFNRLTCAVGAAFDRLTLVEDRVTALEGLRRLVDISFDQPNNQIVETYSDGTMELNDLSVYLDNTDTDTDVQLSNFTISAPDNSGNQTVSFDVVDNISGSVIGNESQTITGAPPTVDTNTFITSINGNTAGGLVTPDANQRFVVQRSDGIQWQLQIPVTTAAFTCFPASIRPLSGTGNSFGRSAFNFVAISGTQVQATATGLVVNVSGSGGSVVVLPETANRFRLGATGTATITMAFSSDIRNLTLNFQDIDAPFENATNFNPSESSITPPFGNNVLSDVLIENINGNTVTFTYTNGGGASTVIYINNVSLAPPCFSAQRCVDGSGVVQFRDLNDNVLTGNYEVC